MSTRHQLQLIGPVQLCRPDGEQVVLRNQRARAVLVLLALSPQMRRSRRWIEAQLWSTRDTAQASSSLRQVIRALRVTLGQGQEVIDADRSDLWLNADAIEVDLLADPERLAAARAEGRELIEDLIIPDPAFKDWTERTRRYHARALGSDSAPAPASAAATMAPNVPIGSAFEDAAHIIVSADVSGSHAERAIAQAIGRQIAQSAAEACPVDIHADATGAASLHPHSIIITPVVVDKGGTSMVSFEVSQPAQSRLVWSDRILSAQGGVTLLNNEDVIGLANVASEQVTRGLASTAKILDPGFGASADALRSHALIEAGINALFSFDVRQFPQSMRYFQQADSERSGPLVQAWMALLCSVRLVEREAAHPEQMRADAVEHLRRALAGGVENPTILGITSQVASFLKLDDFDAYHFAERALRINPWNPMAKLALGLAQMRRGRSHEGYVTCRDARAYASGLKHRHWWDMSFSLAALSRGNTAEAIEAAERALAFHPHFRPPMRHLYALYLHAGEYAKAGRMLERMRRLEPDFSLRMMREEPDYPMVTIRRTPLGALSDLA